MFKKLKSDVSRWIVTAGFRGAEVSSRLAVVGSVLAHSELALKKCKELLIYLIRSTPLDLSEEERDEIVGNAYRITNGAFRFKGLAYCKLALALYPEEKEKEEEEGEKGKCNCGICNSFYTGPDPDTTTPLVLIHRNPSIHGPN